MRQPLLVVFVLGTTVSVLASGQFTLRLIVDGAVSFAFVPVCEAAGIAAVWYWSGFAPAMQHLDGAEVCHPSIFSVDEAQDVFARFAARGPVAAIGSSDFHGFGRMGMCRTFVFASDAGTEAILDAIRARRTVVYGLQGRVYGHPELIRLAEADGRLAAAARPDRPVGRLERLGQVTGLIGLSGLVFARRRS